MMKHKLLISVAVMSLYLPLSTSFAAQAGQQEMMQDVAALQSELARIKYQVSDEKLQLSAIEKLEQPGGRGIYRWTAELRPIPSGWRPIGDRRAIRTNAPGVQDR